MLKLTLAAALVALAGSVVQAQEKAVDAKAPAAAQPETKPAAKKLVVGDQAPALTIAKWVKGEPITGFEKGKVYVVEFWATWCGPCIASMPHLSHLQKTHKEQGLTIVGVTSGGRSNTLEAVEKMVADKGDTMGYTVAFDTERTTSNDYMRAAGQNGIPCSFVVDKAGKIAYIGHPMYLDPVLDKVIAGTWDYTAGPAEIKKIEEELNSVYENFQTDPKAALKTFTALETKYPSLVSGMGDFKYNLQLAAGDAAGAAATGAKLVEKAIAAKDAEALNALSWGIVDPDANVQNKDLDLAMRAAVEAVKITQEKDGAILDTLARVYWLKGDKAKAIEIQTKAVTVETRDMMKEQLEKTLEEYKSAK